MPLGRASAMASAPSSPPASEPSRAGQHQARSTRQRPQGRKPTALARALRQRPLGLEQTALAWALERHSTRLKSPRRATRPTLALARRSPLRAMAVLLGLPRARWPERQERLRS
eukprot:1279708-Prymnesium_polylepis.1